MVRNLRYVAKGEKCYEKDFQPHVWIEPCPLFECRSFCSKQRQHALEAIGVGASNAFVSLNPNVPMPLASTFKIVLLAAYAREVSHGRLNPNELVAISDWERNYLPGTDGGYHPSALSGLGIVSRK